MESNYKFEPLSNGVVLAYVVHMRGVTDFCWSELGKLQDCNPPSNIPKGNINPALHWKLEQGAVFEPTPKIGKKELEKRFRGEPCWVFANLEYDPTLP